MVELGQRFSARHEVVLESAPAHTVVAVYLGADAPIAREASSTCKERKARISQ